MAKYADNSNLRRFWENVKNYIDNAVESSTVMTDEAVDDAVNMGWPVYDITNNADQYVTVNKNSSVSSKFVTVTTRINLIDIVINYTYSNKTKTLFNGEVKGMSRSFMMPAANVTIIAVQGGGNN